jgi:hypothetical protein
MALFPFGVLSIAGSALLVLAALAFPLDHAVAQAGARADREDAQAVESEAWEPERQKAHRLQRAKNRSRTVRPLVPRGPPWASRYHRAILGFRAFRCDAFCRAGP